MGVDAGVDVDGRGLIALSDGYLEYLAGWHASLKPSSLLEIIDGHPERVALFCVDMINGFAVEGPLSSDRVAGIAGPIVDLLTAAHAAGIRNFVLPQDCHTPNAEEFKAYAPHARIGTVEAETIKPIRELPFADEFVIVPKNSLSSVIDTTMGEWLGDHPEVHTWIVVGDCTDLCLYQMAMYLRLAANAPDLRRRRMILPVNCIQTFDLGLHTAAAIHTVPHPGDMYDYVFLNQMARNAIEIVRAIV